MLRILFVVENEIHDVIQTYASDATYNCNVTACTLTIALYRIIHVCQCICLLDYFTFIIIIIINNNIFNVA